jgi:hypothetical protein
MLALSREQELAAVRWLKRLFRRFCPRCGRRFSGIKPEGRGSTDFSDAAG